ncbi:hypothetical protein [Saliphagus infecundisoli]|uniref:Uncharacterized protein n=1 Tax=Saliphagus infecundisoli TaxID=1849069 RepID=A0ABD5QJ48_9EURY|nr:hypothetical protein [Saliphagus infecundisoli]
MTGRRSADPVGSRRLKAAFVALVGGSGGLVALQGDAAPLLVALAVLGGLLAGFALLAYLRWIV